MPGRKCGRGGLWFVDGAKVKLALWDALTKQQGALLRCMLATFTGLNLPSGKGPTNNLVPGAIAPFTSKPPKTG